MADLYLDLLTGTTEITGGKLRETTDAVHERQQRCLIAMRTHRGEWLYDTSRGLPWREEIAVKAPDLNRVAARIRAYLYTVEGVQTVRRVDVSLDRVTRIMTIQVDLITDAGATGPFNIMVTT